MKRPLRTYHSTLPLAISYGLLFTLLLSCSPSPEQHSTAAEPEPDTSAWQPAQFRQYSHPLPHQILYPTDFSADERYPLLLFLHGAGERGEDNQAQLSHGGQLFLDSTDRYPAIVLFPQCAQGEYWAYMNPDTLLPDGRPARVFSQDAQPFASVVAMEHLLDSMLRLPYIDTTRIYVAGLSMGGMGTAQLLAKYPGRFAAASVICGAAPLQYAEALARTPTSIYIGLDDPVVAPVYSQHYFQAIDDGRGTHRLIAYPGTGHAAWDSAFAEPDFLSWMFDLIR